jgi:hypothetical protein
MATKENHGMTQLEPFGFVRRCGWECDESTGKEVFRAIVEYPNGPPDGLSWSIVWDTVPVQIVVVRPEPPMGAA